MPTKFALDLQLLGGVWMIQVFPAIIFGLYTRWFSGSALFGGWLVGFVLGTYLSFGHTATPELMDPSTWLSWGTVNWNPTYEILDGVKLYNGVTAVACNIGVTVLLSFILRPTKQDAIAASDFLDAAKA